MTNLAYGWYKVQISLDFCFRYLKWFHICPLQLSRNWKRLKDICSFFLSYARESVRREAFGGIATHHRSSRRQ